jgi:hypothetical protein
MSTSRCDRVAKVVWSIYAQESGTDTEAAQLLPHACTLRPALRALRLAQAFDDWSIVDLPPRTFYALMGATKILRAEAPLLDDTSVSTWCRYNEEGLLCDALPAVPQGLPWARTLADVRNAAIVLGLAGDLDLSGLEPVAETHNAGTWV